MILDDFVLIKFINQVNAAQFIKSDQTIADDLTVWNVLGKLVERKTLNTK